MQVLRDLVSKLLVLQIKIYWFKFIQLEKTRVLLNWDFLVNSERIFLSVRGLAAWNYS
jgi:hypothetical protein